MKYVYNTEVFTVRKLKEALSHFNENAIVFIEDKSSKKIINFIDSIEGNDAFGLKPQVLLNIDVEESEH